MIHISFSYSLFEVWCDLFSLDPKHIWEKYPLKREREVRAPSLWGVEGGITRDISWTHMPLPVYHQVLTRVRRKQSAEGWRIKHQGFSRSCCCLCLSSQQQQVQPALRTDMAPFPRETNQPLGTHIATKEAPKWPRTSGAFILFIHGTVCRLGGVRKASTRSSYGVRFGIKSSFKMHNILWTEVAPLITYLSDLITYLSDPIREVVLSIP